MNPWKNFNKQPVLNCNKPNPLLKSKDDYVLLPGRNMMDTDVICWHLTVPSPNLDPEIQLEVIDRSFKNWEECLKPIITHCTEDPSDANIEIFFEDPDNPSSPRADQFANNTRLAFAYYPVGNYSDIYFDQNRNWITSGNTGFFVFENTMTHEIGHSLGFAHTTVVGDIMHTPYSNNRTITQDSKDAVEDLYGDLQDDINNGTYGGSLVIPREITDEERREINILKTLYPSTYSLYILPISVLDELIDFLGLTLRNESRSRYNKARLVYSELHFGF